MSVYHDRKNAGKCVRCGKREPMPGMTACGRCQENRVEWNKEQVRRTQESGFCGRHRTRKVVPTYKQCIVCIVRDRNRKRKQGRAA